MTTKLEDKLYKLGQSVGLTFDEREAMRARLLSKIAVSDRKVLSPFSPMFYWRSISMYVKPQYVSVALLVVLIGGGVSLAAEKSLPGEPLYQVKTSVNENVLGLFAFTPQSKAQLHTELAVRRLEEVESLAISGKLDATTTAAAEVKIDGNLSVIKDSIKQLSSENKDAAAADTSSKAESSLKVHEAILGTISDGSAAVNASVKDMALSVGIQTTALSLDRAAIDSKISTTTLSPGVLLDQQKNATDAIDLVKAAFATSTEATTTSLLLNSNDDIASTTFATSTATTTATTIVDVIGQKVQEKITESSDFLKQANEKLLAKEYGEAFVLFKKAEKAALEGQLLLKPDMLIETTSTTTSTSPVI